MVSVMQIEADFKLEFCPEHMFLLQFDSSRGPAMARMRERSYRWRCYAQISSKKEATVTGRYWIHCELDLSLPYSSCSCARVFIVQKRINNTANLKGYLNALS
jgi:hypothetical protein